MLRQKKTANMSSLIKVFFGVLKKDKVLKSNDFCRGFWGFEEDFIKLNEPVNWRHGVFQYFSNNHDEFWTTLTGFFKKTKIENFGEIKNGMIEIHPEFNTLSDLLELITISGGDLFDLKDEFDLGDTIINGVEDNEFIDLENYSKFNLEGDNSIWIFEVFKYQDVKYNIVNKNLDLIYETSDDLSLIDRFTFSVLLKTKH
jgi:hypothetical protein